MEFAVLGWPPDGPTLRLDWRQFSYAGKFVMSTTGKAVISDPAATRRPDDEFARGVLAAVAFNEDRTDPGTLWLRYVTVRSDRRGEGLGPRLVAFVVARARDRGYEQFRIAVNNPFAYEALYKAGFGFTGRETGVAELVLAYPAPDPGRDRYQAGLAVFRERDWDADDPEAAFLASRAGADPPDEDLVADHEVRPDRGVGTDRLDAADTGAGTDRPGDADRHSDADDAGDGAAGGDGGT